MRGIRAFQVCLGMALAAPSPGSGAESSASFEPKLRQLYADQEIIKSGRVQCEQITTTFGVTGIPLTVASRVEAVFANGRTRFTREDEALVTNKALGTFDSHAQMVDEASRQLENGTFRRELRRYVLVLAENTAHLYRDENKQLELQVDAEHAKRFIRFFDPRSIGLRPGAHPEALHKKGMELRSLVNEKVNGRETIRGEYRNSQGFLTTIWYDPDLPAVVKIENSSSSATLRGVVRMEYDLAQAEGPKCPTQITSQQFDGERLISEEVIKVREARFNVPIALEEFKAKGMKLRSGTILIQNSPQPKPVGVWRDGRIIFPSSQPDGGASLIEALGGKP